MSVQTKLDKILTSLENLTKRLDVIDRKLEAVNSKINEVEEKFDEKYNKLEAQLNDKVSQKDFSDLEKQFKKQMELIYEENLMKEMYDKRLNLLIHDIEESVASTWESKEQTIQIFQEFLSQGLSIDPKSMNIIDIHCLPQRPVFVNGAKKTRPIIVKLSTIEERKRIFSSLKNLKNFNKVRKESNTLPVYVTEHLPKDFQNQKKRLMPQFKEARKLNKSTYWRVVQGQYCLFVDNVKILPTW